MAEGASLIMREIADSGAAAAAPMRHAALREGKCARKLVQG